MCSKLVGGEHGHSRKARGVRFKKSSEGRAVRGVPSESLRCWEVEWLFNVMGKIVGGMDCG